MFKPPFLDNMLIFLGNHNILSNLLFTKALNTSSYNSVILMEPSVETIVSQGKPMNISCLPAVGTEQIIFYIMPQQHIIHTLYMLSSLSYIM